MRWLQVCLIFMTGIPKLVTWHLYILNWPPALSNLTNCVDTYFMDLFQAWHTVILIIRQLTDFFFQTHLKGLLNIIIDIISKLIAIPAFEEIIYLKDCFPFRFTTFIAKLVLSLNTLRPRKMADIFQTTFSNAFSWMKMYKCQLRFHWSLFPRVQLTIFHHWFR